MRPLPTVETFSFPVTLPSSKEEISVRPFLVREEKLLLMAQESDDYASQAEAVAQVIRNCTSGVVEPSVAPFFDIEYLLLQLRAKSVGEIATPTYSCHNKPDGETECGFKTTVRKNLQDITVDVPADNNLLKIVLSPKHTLTLRYPTIYTVNEMFLSVVNDTKVRGSKLIDSLTGLFDTLVETADGADTVTYQFSDYSEQEKLDFMSSLASSNYDKILEFLEAVPTLKTTLEFECEKCKFQHVITLSGLTDFLAWR